MMTPNSSLLQWLATFELNGQPSVDFRSKNAYPSLVDGHICARILNQIAPKHFSDKWLEGIKPVPLDGSWPLRVSNLNRINSKIHDYTSDLQSSRFKPSAIIPDFGVIAINFDADQISRLIQLILFCAITCDKQQEYIERMRALPTKVQEDIKKAIEQLLIKSNEASQELNNSVNSDSDIDMTSTPKHRVNLNSSTTISPSRSSVYRSLFRRTSSQSSTGVSRQSEQHDIQNHSNHDDENLEEVKQRLTDALLVKEEKTQACHDLEQKLKQLQLERDQLAYDNEKLIGERSASTYSQIPIKSTSSPYKSTRRTSAIDSRDEDNRLKNSEEENPQALLLKIRELQEELNEIKRKNVKIESEKEEFRLKSKLLQDDLEDSKAKHEELRNKAELARRLQDELDEQKQLSEKLTNYEATIENLIKKNSETKKELKNLEEKNKANIIQIVSLEEVNSKLNTDLNGMKIYQKQLKELQSHLSQETYRADKAEVEVTRLTDKYVAVRKENEKLYETTNQLMRTSVGGMNRQASSGSVVDGNLNNREFDSVNLKSTNLAGSSRISNKTLFEENLENNQENAANDSLPTSVIELKEKLARLEYENELLQNKVAAKRDSDQSVLGGLLDSANTRCNKLELEKRELSKKILLLEGHLRDLSNSHNGASTSSAMMNDSSSDNVLALINRVEELQRLLLQKDHELLESDAKYKKNLQKAKDVIKTLNSNQSINSSLHPSCMSSTSSFNSGSLDETNLLKQQLKERDERLIEMERKFYEFKKLKEIHERLIMSAFYGLTTPMQWKNANRRVERTSLTSPPNTASSSINQTKHSH